MKLPSPHPLLARTLLALAATALHHPASADRGDQADPATTPAAWCAGRCDAVVTDWSVAALQVIQAADGYQNPLTASRALAMLHLAMHDAVNSVRPRFRRFAAGAVAINPAADPAVAASAAAAGVLAALYPQPAATALTHAAHARVLLEAGTGPRITAASQIGQAAAQAVLAQRSNDGSGGAEPYTEGTHPGAYRFTPPFDFTLMPHWRQVTPFGIASASQFRTAPPPDLASPDYARDFNEVRRVGGKDSAARTTDQSHYAAFWYELSDIGWNRVARAASGRVQQDLWERARSFALLNMALADTYIAGWDSKFHHDFWRPVTAIHLAGTDGNALTQPDAAFEPFLPTPPVPDMPSTHAALGMAAATVLAETFGRDHVPIAFASSSALPTNAVRAFRSFSEAARENADSRVRAGLHFRFAVEAGLRLGQQVGRHVARHQLQPAGGAND
ncbi:vanadium-dependent haloperoxidase [Rubrivivax sp. RP6-9]|uniref:vanadium-dependent haloperoxidase n=1 Tax=Rubrivivax sp. RP6-9 TaxID=3415750 RepID=UPI003CC5789E